MSDQISSAPPQVSALGGSQRIRRVFDVSVACLSLVTFAPIMLAITIAVLLESGRPVLFQQTRIGQHGRLFLMYKFRKFRKDCNRAGFPLTLAGDCRMTVTGSVLMATKLDELPQFWNVLRGDMSIVGPRPETPAFEDCFSGIYKRVLEHKPGILGPSQVLFRNESSLYSADIDPKTFYRSFIFPTKAHIDLDYYPTRGLGSDLLWIIRAAMAVLGWMPSLSRMSHDVGGAGELRKGAHGVAIERSAAE